MSVRRHWLAFALAWFAAASSPLLAQSTQPLDAAEYQVKAAYVYKFVSFVEWPDDAFPTADSPLVIGVIGADDIAAALKAIVERQTVNHRRLVVRRLDGKATADALQVLVIGAVDRTTLDRTLKNVHGRPVLVVSSQKLDDAPEVMINFVTLERRVRFEVSLDPATQSRLRMSALMLSVAYRVSREAQW